MDATRPDRRRILERDAAARRLGSLTLAAAAVATAVTGALAAVTATSSHTRKTVQRVLARSSTPASSRAVPPVPEPNAVALGSGAAPSPPQTAPSATSAPAVAVSGGS